MYVYKLHLKTSRRQEKELELRFYLMWRVHVVLVKHAQKLLRFIDRDRAYQKALSGYRDAGKRLEKLEAELEAARKSRTRAAGTKKPRKIRDIRAEISSAKKEQSAFAEAMSTIRESIGLTEYGLQEYAKVQQHKYAAHLQSQEVQKEATRVWSGADKVLFGNGKRLRIPRLNDIRSICGKQKETGIRFSLSDGKVLWNGLELDCGMRTSDGQTLPRNAYEAIALGEDFAYCEVVRLPFPKGYRYYLHIYMRGEVPDVTPAAPAKRNGIDPGVSTMASVSEDGACMLEELAPDVKRYNRIIQKLSTQLEAERRRANPGNYLPDGRIRRGRKVWVRTKRYNQTEMLLRSWYRKKSGYVKTAHGTLANRILQNGNRILVEAMRYQALARRSGKTERQKQASAVRKKDGTTQLIHKYKRKKRFGRSLNNRSPALFLQLLKKKALASGGSYQEVDTAKLCASQYDHVQDKKVKTALNCRMKDIGGHQVQRDLYSAFLIVHVKDDLSTPDRDRCTAEFESFVSEHDQLIRGITAKKPVRPACFGF